MQHLHEIAHLAVELVRLSALSEPATAAEDDHIANRSTLNRKRHAPRIPYRGACSALKSRSPQQSPPFCSRTRATQQPERQFCEIDGSDRMLVANRDWIEPGRAADVSGNGGRGMMIQGVRDQFPR